MNYATFAIGGLLLCGVTALLGGDPGTPEQPTQPMAQASCCMPNCQGCRYFNSQNDCIAAGGTPGKVLCTLGPCESPRAADVNKDGIVGINDLLQLLAEWGAPCETGCVNSYCPELP